MSYEHIIRDLKDFQLSEQLASENELETKVTEFLKKKGYRITRQHILQDIRNDIIINEKGKKYCLELKIVADFSIANQVATYMRFYQDGIIILCWKASRTLQRLVDKASRDNEIKIPIKIIQIRENQSLA